MTPSLYLFEGGSEEKHCPLPFEQISINFSSSRLICQHFFWEALKLYWPKDIDMRDWTQESSKPTQLKQFLNKYPVKHPLKTSLHFCKYIAFIFWFDDMSVILPFQWGRVTATSRASMLPMTRWNRVRRFGTSCSPWLEPVGFVLVLPFLVILLFWFGRKNVRK